MRVEPEGLTIATGGGAPAEPSRGLRRSDMAIGKMSAALEVQRAARRAGSTRRSSRPARSGSRSPAARRARCGAARLRLRRDRARGDGALRRRAGAGRGAGSSSTGQHRDAALLRGAMPTHLVLCHRAGQETLAGSRRSRSSPRRTGGALRGPGRELRDFPRPRPPHRAQYFHIADDAQADGRADAPGRDRVPCCDRCGRSGQLLER